MGISLTAGHTATLSSCLLMTDDYWFTQWSVKRQGIIQFACGSALITPSAARRCPSHNHKLLLVEKVQKVLYFFHFNLLNSIILHHLTMQFEVVLLGKRTSRMLRCIRTFQYAALLQRLSLRV